MRHEELHTTSNQSRSHSNKGLTRTVTQNQQLRESYAVLPATLQDLPDLKGYIKISGYPAAPIQIKISKFHRTTRRFIATRTSVR